MDQIRYTLLSDGSSDRALIPLLTWLLRQKNVQSAIQPEWADLGKLRQRPRLLHERIRWSLQLYPCNLLFIHRDAEREPHRVRVAEIQRAVNRAANGVVIQLPPVVCVVPIRMQEAWLLISESALRRAAANPHGRQSLQLPQLVNLEQLPDPKSTLHDLLAQASGLQGRKLEKFHARSAAHRVAELISDFSPLRSLTAFRALEADIERFVNEQGWNADS